MPITELSTYFFPATSLSLSLSLSLLGARELTLKLNMRKDKARKGGTFVYPAKAKCCRYSLCAIVRLPHRVIATKLSVWAFTNLPRPLNRRNLRFFLNEEQSCILWIFSISSFKESSKFAKCSHDSWKLEWDWRVAPIGHKRYLIHQQLTKCATHVAVADHSKSRNNR